MAAKLGGLKGGKYAIGQNADINVTPFVDVMLVLLIIFMVSAPLATVAIKIDLPPADTPPPNRRSQESDLHLHPGGGHIYIVDKPTTLTTLTDDLQRPFNVRSRRKDDNPDPRRPGVHYSDFMSVVNQLQADGYFKVSLITENLA